MSARDQQRVAVRADDQVVVDAMAGTEVLEAERRNASSTLWRANDAVMHGVPVPIDEHVFRRVGRGDRAVRDLAITAGQINRLRGGAVEFAVPEQQMVM